MYSYFQKHTINMILNITTYGFFHCSSVSPTCRCRISVFEFSSMLLFKDWRNCRYGWELSSTWKDLKVPTGFNGIWIRALVLVSGLEKISRGNGNGHPITTAARKLASAWLEHLTSFITNYNGIFILRVCGISFFNNEVQVCTGRGTSKSILCSLPVSPR